MFFDEISQITEIAQRTGTAIFVVPNDVEVEIKGSVVVMPENKSVISIEQVRELFAGLNLKQTGERFIIIRPAEKLGLEASNALLKILEEPKDKVHFVLVTSMPSKLLPTIKSRAEIYFLRIDYSFDADIKADDEVKQIAKKLITAKNGDLAVLADEITRKKDKARERALNVLATAIEMLYKSYFLTKKEVFIKKIPQFLMTYENIANNGHVKLHLIADLC